MKISLSELKEVMLEVLEEARKKKEKGDPQLKSLPGYKKDEKLDFSKPLGSANLYKRQGQSNFGPYTEEKALRIFIGGVIAEAIGEGRVGFKKMVKKLAHQKGVTDPAGLAASIGREKYGKKAMAKKAAAGRKK